MIRVKILPIGPVAARLDLETLLKRMNAAQVVYVFSLGDALLDPPAPTIPRSDGTNGSPEYDADRLFEYMAVGRKLSDDQTAITCGVVDSEIFDDLWSVSDRTNTMILVTTRVSSLPGVLRVSRRPLEQYVELEIAIQLLTIDYRGRVGLSVPPNRCGLPWHVERLGCLFDYYGLSEQNVQKLVAPRLSDRVSRDLVAAGVEASSTNATLALARDAAKVTDRELTLQALSDPAVGLTGIGVIVGLTVAIVSTMSWNWWLGLVAISLTTLSTRLYQLRTGRNLRSLGGRVTHKLLPPK